MHAEALREMDGQTTVCRIFSGPFAARRRTPLFTTDCLGRLRLRSRRELRRDKRPRHQRPAELLEHEDRLGSAEPEPTVEPVAEPVQAVEPIQPAEPMQPVEPIQPIEPLEIR